ncbi:MAG: NADH-quinone oxidoreductase subunit I [Bacteriovoracaceae bacterium]|nr:NADH-quinone oxidoreductase subunit I [Bacteriovoracaceae bacterium]
MGTINVSRKYTLAQKIYLYYIIKGMLINLKRFFRGLFLQENWTIQYPEQRREYSQRFRGAHFISVDKNKTENCTACFLCETVCPAECIHIIAEERPEDENTYGVWKEKKPASFDIDLLRCCFCGFCEEACPKDAIKLSRDYEMSVATRDEAIFDLNHLKREVKGRG